MSIIDIVFVSNKGYENIPQHQFQIACNEHVTNRKVLKRASYLTKVEKSKHEHMVNASHVATTS